MGLVSMGMTYPAQDASRSIHVKTADFGILLRQVKWYALAVVLAELCTAQGPLADRAWQVAQIIYDDYAKVVADTKKGLLWKPIAKLMRRVRDVRESHAAAQMQTDPLPTGPYSQGNSVFADPVIDTSLAAYSQATLAIAGPSYNPNPTFGSLPYGFNPSGASVARGADDMSSFYWDLLISDLNDPNMFDGYVLPKDFPCVTSTDGFP